MRELTNEEQIRVAGGCYSASCPHRIYLPGNFSQDPEEENDSVGSEGGTDSVPEGYDTWAQPAPGYFDLNENGVYDDGDVNTAGHTTVAYDPAVHDTNNNGIPDVWRPHLIS